MKAICENELVIDCAGYKAIDSGVVLLGGTDDKDALAFVPEGKLEYVLPDDVVEREHERLGLPAPELTSPADLESRLDEFADEIDALRETLDRQVEDVIDEGAAVDETDVERQERLRERRRTIDRSLKQVRQRAQQFQQLSRAEATSEAETGASAAEAAAAGTRADAGEGETSFREAVDERLDRIERQLAELTSAEGEAAPGAETETEAAPKAETEAAPGAETEAAPGADEGETEAATGGEMTIDDADIDGLGPTYRSRLHDAGIDTIGDLAARSPGEVAEATSAAPSRAEDWVARATELVEGEQEAAA